MNIGMLWWMNPKSDLSFVEHVDAAANYYQQKYGRVADTCMVHPSMLGTALTTTVGNISIRPNRAILSGHLWIGTEDK